MARLRLIAAFLLALVVPSGAASASVDRWSGFIAEASVRFGIPEAWIRRVMVAESGGRTTLNGRPIESHAGAMGLMQLMPATWRHMRSALGLGQDPHDPRDNILAGTAYLRRMYDRFGHPGLFAAYNAGPGSYSAYLAGRRRLPAETIAYVAAVAGRQPRVTPSDATGTVPAPMSSQTLFVFRRSEPDARAAIPEASPRSTSSLFHALRGAR